MLNLGACLEVVRSTYAHNAGDGQNSEDRIITRSAIGIVAIHKVIAVLPPAGFIVIQQVGGEQHGAPAVGL